MIFLVCAQVETKEWNGIKERKRSTHTNQTNKKMVADLSVGKKPTQNKKRKGRERVKNDYMKDIPIYPT